jgi:hypothetical protein
MNKGLSLPKTLLWSDDQGLSLLLYGQGSDEAQTMPKYQGKMYYFDLQLIIFPSKLSMDHSKHLFMVMNL